MPARSPRPALRLPAHVLSASLACRKNFCKAMTTHADHRVWQDVYHGKTADGIAVHVKLTVIDDVLIVSFKEL